MRTTSAARFVALFASFATGAGCTTLRTLEPVIAPPPQFQVDRSVSVEFVASMEIGVRCAARGATFLGMPAFNSGACGDHDLLTLPSPCDADIGDYAAGLCAALSTASEQQNSASGLQKAAWRKTTPVREPSDGLTIAFVHPDLIAARCSERGKDMTTWSSLDSVACQGDGWMMIVNPCLSDEESWFVAAACHELAHANGWPADHAHGSFGRQPSFVKRDLAPGDVLSSDAVRIALEAKRAAAQAQHGASPAAS